MNNMIDLDDVQHRINNTILGYLPKQDADFPQLTQAMAYAIFNGGKRLRPALVYFTGEMLGATLNMLDPIACAVEMVHCFSLVHDDLPAMDNSDYRRGKLSCHKVFGEAVAILAGDNLLTLAMEILSNAQNAPLPLDTRLKLIRLLCKATGAEGMVGGQIMDINNVATYGQDQLQKLHCLKTGALIKASVLMGTLSAPSTLSPVIEEKLNQFAEILGLLYQVCDDILDVTADETVLGKTRGTDKQLGKGTYVDLLGIDDTKRYAFELYKNSLDITNTLPKSEQLAYISHYIYSRLAK